MSPLRAAKSTEKVVSLLCGGASALTWRRACVSVMMRWGGWLSRCRVLAICCGWQATMAQCFSNSSRMVCCCGRMSRPCGASRSCGMMSITRSPSWAHPSVIWGSPPLGATWIKVCRSRSMPSPRVALVATVGRAVASARAWAWWGASSSRSLLLRATTIGLPSRRCCHAFTKTVSAWSTTTVTMSARRRACRVFSTRSEPTCPSSSTPAVSVMTQAPRPCISMALPTGSVVVPGCADTMAACWPTRALSSDDLPLLRLPTSTMCRRAADGVSFRVMGQNLKSRSPCSMSARCCSAMRRVFGLSISSSDCRIRASPLARVSGEA